MLYGGNVLFNQSELPKVAAEWTRLASGTALLVLVQYFEPDLVNALAHELLKLKAGWAAVAYEHCGAAGARTVVLRRGGGVGAVVVPRVKLKRRYESTAQCGLVYRIDVPPAGPSKQYPYGFEGGSYSGSSCRSDMDPSLSGEKLFLKGRGREHLNALEAGTHPSRQLQHAIYAHRAVPGGNRHYLPFAADGSDVANVTVTKRNLRKGQFSWELITETVDFEQIDLDALGKLYPAGRRLATSWKAGSPDPDICSDAGQLLPSPPCCL